MSKRNVSRLRWRGRASGMMWMRLLESELRRDKRVMQRGMACSWQFSSSSSVRLVSLQS